MESAAGIAALTKVVLQMQYRHLVPSLHAEKLNTKIEFESTPFYVQREFRNWKNHLDNPVSTRIAALSPFCAGGANANFKIQEHNVGGHSENLPRLENKAKVVLLSAKNEDRLKTISIDLSTYLKGIQSSDLESNQKNYLLDLGNI